MQDNDDILLEYYDELFPVNRNAVDFITVLAGRYTIAGPVKVLEIGCATGTVSLQLAQQGMDVIGIDTREAFVQSANRRNHEPKSNARFFCMPLPGCQSYFPPESFHIIICLGDVLAGIGSLDDIRRMFRQVYQLLYSGGTFVFQLTNYDRIIKERIESLPEIKTGRARLACQYTPTEDGLLRFTSSIYSLAGSLVYSRDQMLYPLTSKRLAVLLKNAVFTPEDCFAAFDRTPFDTQSLNLAGTAQKN